MLNATFNNISVILWLSVLLMEETGIPGENHQRVRVRVDNSAYKTLVHKLKIGFLCLFIICKYLLFRFLLMKFDIFCFKYKTIREWKLYHNHVAYVMEKKDM